MAELTAQTWNVEESDAGTTLAAFLKLHVGELSWNQARALCRTGKIKLDGRGASDPAVRLKVGQEIALSPSAPRKRAGHLDNDAIRYADREVVVVMKPPGLLSVPYDEEKDTLIDLTRATLRRRDQAKAKSTRYDPSLGIVHRLDKDTSGLLVFTRTLAAKKHLSAQFRDRIVDRHYVALVHGHPRTERHDTHLITNRGDGLRGSWGHFRNMPGGPPPGARRAITDVEVLERFDNSSLVRCKLSTGRQHQIRIHLAEAGHPLIGERVYIRDFGGIKLPAPRIMLHARELGFEHPKRESPCHTIAEPPEDFKKTLAELRGT